MTQFNLNQAKENLAVQKEDNKLYKMYSSTSGKLYIVLGLANHPIEKVKYVIFQETNQDKSTNVLSLADFLGRMKPVKVLKYEHS